MNLKIITNTEIFINCDPLFTSCGDDDERLVLLPADEPHLYWTYRASEDSENLYDAPVEAFVLGKFSGVNEWSALTRGNFTEVRRRSY